MRVGTADTSRASRSAWWCGTPALAAVLLASHVYFHAVYPNFANPNMLSRAYVAMSVAEKGSFTIDSYLLRHGDIMDKARYGGHYYSDKPPGGALLLAPIAFVLRLVLPDDVSIGTRLELLRLFGLSLPLVILWLSSLRTFESVCGDRRRAVAIVLAGALGTHFFVYATSLFAHAQAAVLVFLSFLLFEKARRDADARRWRRRYFLAGLLLAYAFICDFILLLAAIAFGLFVLYSTRRRRNAGLAFVLGCLPPLLLLLAYNYTCFDNPLRQGFHFHADALYGKEYREGLLGIHAPDPAAWLGMSVLPERGIFFFSPILALGLGGLALMLRERGERTLAAAALLLVAGTCLFTTTTVDWKGGWAASMRYLVPVVPFLLFGVARVARDAARVRWLSWGIGALFLVGLFHAALTASTFPFFPEGFVNPIYNFCLPLLDMGGITASLLGLAGTSSLAGFAIVMAAAGAILLSCWFSGTARARGGSILISLVLAGAIVLLFSAIHEPPAAARGRAQAYAYVLERMGVRPLSNPGGETRSGGKPAAPVPGALPR